ncbi:MAG: CatB-related O-acetyltransferase [Planctomycetes bacterium]|nr:CatB-related O-acetyltransferase [Planctomycetota bacterium]
MFKHYHDVEIGKYSHGGCFVPGQFSRYTKIGAYCSIARSAVGLTRDHPLKFKSTHGLFFNPKVGFVDVEKVEFVPLEIANDVWIGHNTTILPGTRTIGNGAVIGAGAVVNRAVPPYAVVVGNPARVVKFRFSADVIARLEAEAWWTRDLDDLQADKHSFTTPLESGYE